MAKWDKEYLNLCKKILKEGIEVPNRTGINTIKIPAYNFHFDLEEEFPILTTKTTYIRQAVLEMLWIYQAQSNDVRWLQDRNVHIWDQWEINEDGYWVSDQYDVTKNGEKKLASSNHFFGKEYAHTIGSAYGYVVKKYGLIDRTIKLIKENPFDRRNVISLWQEDCLETGVLKPCVWSSEWDVTDGKLNAWVHQRSCDVPLGLPFNVSQYAVLLNMLAQISDLKPGTLDWSIKNAHIYKNQISGIQEQIKRGESLPDLKAPDLWLNPNVKDFYDFDNSKECQDVKVLNYKNHGKINFPLAQ